MASLPDRQTAETSRSGAGSVGEVFVVFLKLGLISFGGPIAHLGYFRDEFVIRRRWISEAAYAELVALSQFLPGPASSQVGFSLGILRGNGLVGGLAAWAGFTLPSAILMMAFGFGAPALSGELAQQLLHGLKLVAAAVVAQAVWGMARTLTPDLTRALIAAVALAFALLVGGPFGQVAPIAGGALAGLLFCHGQASSWDEVALFPVSHRAGMVAIALAVAIFAALPLAAALVDWAWIDRFQAFYHSGALVFGGGHVVLPLLESAVVEPGWIDQGTFLSGYGLAQAMPGPLFTFGAYLGAAMVPGMEGVASSLLALVAIFLPGLLLIYGALPFAGALQRNSKTQSTVQGANAAVVGILAAAFYEPVLVESVAGWTDAALAVAGFALLVFAHVPSWGVVALLPALAMLLAP